MSTRRDNDAPVTGAVPLEHRGAGVRRSRSSTGPERPRLRDRAPVPGRHRSRPEAPPCAWCWSPATTCSPAPSAP